MVDFGTAMHEVTIVHAGCFQVFDDGDGVGLTAIAVDKRPDNREPVEPGRTNAKINGSASGGCVVHSAVSCTQELLIEHVADCTIERVNLTVHMCRCKREGIDEIGRRHFIRKVLQVIYERRCYLCLTDVRVKVRGVTCSEVDDCPFCVGGSC